MEFIIISPAPSNSNSLTNFIGLLAENSRVTKTKGFVYKDKDWINALHDYM